jgi:hypothetical protein
MINNDHIVPVQKCDFLSLVGIMLNIHGTSYTVAKAADVEGNFVLADGSVFLCDQPVKTLDFGELTAGTAYFVAAYDFAGITGAEDAEIKADGITLYKAVIADTVITVTAVTP